METYSINNDTIIESKTYNLIGQASIDLNPIFTIFKDNENKEINPHDIRDSILTVWSNSSFKETIISNSEIKYIGIDSGNINYNKDIKNKIFFGKRSYLNNDIMSNNLLNNDSDIFLYNTKNDTISNNKTKISILAGTNSSLYDNSPYIQSQLIMNDISSLSLDIINPSLKNGNIDIKCTSGTISIDNIVFPSIQDSILNAGNEKILKWYNNNLSWGNIEYKYEGYAGTTNSSLNIYGNPVNVNNYSIEFTDNRGCPIKIGDIEVGETFTSISIEEMLRRMIYDYSPPMCSLSIKAPNNNCVEVGTSPIIELEYMINKRTLPTMTTIMQYMIPSSYPPITTSVPTVITGIAKGVINLPITNNTATFSIIVNDGTQSNYANATINGIYPYFYGFSSLLSINNSSDLLSLTKLIENVGNKEIPICGSGNLYYIYDYNYPDLNDVLDENGISILENFSLTYSILSSPTGLWVSKKFKIYQWNGVSQIGPPSINYQFKY